MSTQTVQRRRFGRPRLSHRIRAAGRVLVVPFVLVVFAMNVAGGPSHGSISRPPASDAEITAFIADQVRDSGIPGASLAVVRDGRVSTTAAFGTADSTGRPMTADTPFVIGSVSKPITATAVLQLVDAGAVELDAPVQHYLPEFGLASPSAAAAITVRQLLDQTSGLPTAAGARPLSGPVTDLASQVRALADVAPAFVPGTAYAYSNANYLVLGRLVEVVSGRSYADYLQDHVFGPLGMRHATADRPNALANGLGEAHRLWFGLARPVPPLDRPDLAPAGFVTASAADLGRFVAAQVDGGALDGRRILSAAATAEMQRGVAPMGLGDPGRYGLGWADGLLGDVRMVGHVGSTTDMASAVFFSPEQRFGVVVLLNGQSTLYELAHKPDLIGMAAFALLAGREPDGTIAFLYPAFDVAAVLILAWIAWRLLRTVLRMRRGESVAPRPFGRLWLGAILVIWLDAIIPFELFVLVPSVLAAPWSTLVRIDFGQVLLAFALLRLATGLVLVVGAGRVVRARWSARTGHLSRASAG
jgi:CubicO group peptidase (beta-lactamase class C family)